MEKKSALRNWAVGKGASRNCSITETSENRLREESADK
jgi:hypothetical protein